MKYFCDDPELEHMYKKHADDAGFDICAKHDAVLGPVAWVPVETGLHVAIPRGYVGILKPRSGLSLKYGTDVHAGVIDANYRGEIVVLLSASTVEYPVVLHRGDRIAQLCIMKLYDGPAERVGTLEELEETDRGGAGFGSTGGY